MCAQVKQMLVESRRSSYFLWFIDTGFEWKGTIFRVSNTHRTIKRTKATRTNHPSLSCFFGDSHGDKTLVFCTNSGSYFLKFDFYVSSYLNIWKINELELEEGS